MRPLLYPLLLVGVTGCASVRPSDLRPNPWGLVADRLPVGTQTSTMTLRMGEQERPLGTASYTVERPAGSPRLNLYVTQTLAQGAMHDTLVVDAATMRPLRYGNAFGTLQRIAVAYETTGRIVGTTTRQGQTVVRDTTVRGTVLDLAQLQPLLLALPLDESFVRTIPAYDYQSGAVLPTTVRVVEAGTLEQRGTAHPVWKVAYTSRSGVVTHLWVDRSTRRMLRIEADLGQGRRYEEVFD